MISDWVDQTLVGSEKIDKAAMFSSTGDTLLATSEGFNVSLGLNLTFFKVASG